MKDYLLSIIIPVYNTYKYLDRCLESILAENVSGVQIIMIDDGSTDESPAACDRFAEKHENIKVVHQENAGIATVRNTALNLAEGKYIFFVDSDDCIQKGFLESFVSFVENSDKDADMILTDALLFNEETGKETFKGVRFDPSILCGVDGCRAAAHILDCNEYFEWQSWRFFYKTEFVNRHNLRYPVGVRCYEDVVFVVKALLLAQCVRYLPQIGIRYTYGRAGSLVNTISIGKVRDKVIVCQEICDFAEKNIADAKTRELMLANLSSLYTSAFRNYCDGLKEAYPYVKEYAHLLRHSRIRMGVILRKTTKLFGFRIGSFLTKYAFKLLGKGE